MAADRVEQVYRQGPWQSVLDAFKQDMPPFSKPREINQWQAFTGNYRERRNAIAPENRQAFQQQANRLRRNALTALEQQWLTTASGKGSDREKWVLFLQNVWVVQARVVNDPSAIYLHQNRIRENAASNYPEFCKALSRSPAMVRYLDLNQNRRESPNENFARELFELFILGEGNYTENDIKEAARALTGIGLQGGETVLRPRLHDDGRKTIFGKTGRWTLDDVIDLAFAQPAAATFLPGELARFYLSHDPLPTPYLHSLGTLWKKSGYSLRKLAEIFFTSQLFYHESFRGIRIKSPVEFFLGLLADLDLPLSPVATWNIRSLRLMGQEIYSPPNVSGWSGGTAWIHSAAWTARNQWVQRLMHNPLTPSLNADIERLLTDFGQPVSLHPERIPQWWADTSPSSAAIADVIQTLCQRVLPRNPSAAMIGVLEDTFNSTPGPFENKLWETLYLLLRTPEYQLC